VSVYFSEKHRQSRNLPALLSGVYSEFVGVKEQPRALKQRQFIFVFGPSGVGKTIVAKHLLGEGHVLYKKEDLQEVFLQKVRKKRWPDALSNSEKLIIESPCFLGERPQILSLFQGLLRLRLRKGLRTIILDAEDFGPVREILTSIPHEERASLVLRFPSGRGRYRFLAYECRKRGLSLRLAREISEIENWTYAKAFSALEAVEDGRAEIKSR
tara:strand:+ start:969 stop:1607 length:639 start_codon:yes stop_codon:yes gene_type:complete